MGAFLKLKKILEEKESFTLICHVDPDGDAIGSLFAFGEALFSLGKKANLVSRDAIPPVFDFLRGDILVNNEILQKSQPIILLDNGDLRRTGFADQITMLKKRQVQIINIDHHPRNDLWKIADINYVDEKSSSTAEILYRLFLGLGITITPRTATALLSGIYTDTGGFRHSNTSKQVLNIIADLMKQGGRLQKITDNIENSHPISMFRLWGVALNRLTFRRDLGLSVSVLTQQDLVAAEASEEDISGLVNLLNSAPESKCSLLLYETKDGKIKGSLRTESDNVDVSKLAVVLGGGGHKKAAGFTIDGKIEIHGKSWKVV